MPANSLQQQVQFLIEVDKAKLVLRNTILMDASRNENDAEHSWHLALAAMVLREYADDKDLDLLHTIKMALVHDLVEIDAGDTYIYSDANPKEKFEKESEGARRVFGLLPPEQAKQFMALWTEFEEAKTPEARFANALDRLMPLLHNYHTKGRQWQKMKVTSDKVFARNRRIAESSNSLWAYAESMIKEAVTKGYLDE